jgi:hypothetical protein
VIRRRLQLGKMGAGKLKSSSAAKAPYGNMVTGLYTVATTEGVHVLFRGLGPACLEKVQSATVFTPHSSRPCPTAPLNPASNPACPRDGAVVRALTSHLPPLGIRLPFLPPSPPY